MLGESADATRAALNKPADDNEVIRSLLDKCVSNEYIMPRTCPAHLFNKPDRTDSYFRDDRAFCRNVVS